MYILGISCYFHDSAAVLLKDGVVVAAAQEERFTRKKHDSSYPKNAIDYCLSHEKIASQDISYAVFYEKPFLKFERIFLNSVEYAPKSLRFYTESMKRWFFEHAWIKSHIISTLGISSSQILFSEHHLSHAASAYFVSPFKDSAVLTIDGVGEWTTVAWGIGKGSDLQLSEEIRFPHSLGLLYSVFTYFCGYEVNDGEYKLMGLAPYGQPIYEEKIKKLLHLNRDGSFNIDLKFFSYQYSLTGVYSKEFEKIFGKPNKTPDKITKYHADIASSIQKVLEDIVINIAKYVRKKSGLSNLSFAGGVAFNSVANYKVLQAAGFDDIYIQPAAGDAGGALGAALWAYHTVLNNKRKYIMDDVYLGEEEQEEQTVAVFKSLNVKYRKVRNEKLIDEVSEKLAEKKVIGWVQGRFEWGPRSLGNRSILADPRSFEMKGVVNKKIKFREAFRPFAPSIPIEKATKYFDVLNEKSYPFKFMLYVAPVKSSKRKELGAVTHEDGTARPQFVSKKSNPIYHNLISAFGQKTGTPVLLNTSFNLRGEPIVNNSREAYQTFMKSGLDVLVVNNLIIDKKR